MTEDIAGTEREACAAVCREIMAKWADNHRANPDNLLMAGLFLGASECKDAILARNAAVPEEVDPEEAVTTDLRDLRENPGMFSWGKIVQIHDIGQFTIAQYEVPARLRASHAGYHNYYVWVSGMDTGQAFTSLEAAIVGAIAYKYEGAEHDADKYFIAAMARAAQTPGRRRN